MRNSDEEHVCMAKFYKFIFITIIEDILSTNQANFMFFYTVLSEVVIFGKILQVYFTLNFHVDHFYCSVYFLQNFVDSLCYYAKSNLSFKKFPNFHLTNQMNHSQHLIR